MRMKTLLVVLLLVAAAGSASAQSSIDPGMTKDQVVAKLGKPASEHTTGTSTYLYYANGQEKKVGMSDMVVFEDGKVVDAVFRSPSRKYSGKSSSPAPIPTDVAIAKGNGGKMPEKHAEPMKMPAATKKAATPPAKAPETKKGAPPAAKTPETKKTAPPAAKVPETKKAVPPAAKAPEPKTKVDTKKIAAPPAKTDSSNKKSAPAPTKKP
jgi:outer membrane protein assembly factor BamE (lipoprotein component of BamABCDE complex)